MIKFMFRGSSNNEEGPLDEARQQEACEEFQKGILSDSQEVAMKAISSCNSQIKHVLAEVVQQSGNFWSSQLSRLAAAHQAEVAEVHQRLAAVQQQAAEAQRAHEQTISTLRHQLDMAQDALAHAQAGHVRDMARLQDRVGHTETDLHEATRGYQSQAQDMQHQVRDSHVAVRDTDQASQQKAAALLQATEAQRREIQELKRALVQEKAHSAALDERNKKLTALAQHLLAKQAGTPSTSSSSPAAPRSDGAAQPGSSGAAAEGALVMPAMPPVRKAVGPPPPGGVPPPPPGGGPALPLGGGPAVRRPDPGGAAPGGRGALAMDDLRITDISSSPTPTNVSPSSRQPSYPHNSRGPPHNRVGADAHHDRGRQAPAPAPASPSASDPFGEVR